MKIRVVLMTACIGTLGIAGCGGGSSNVPAAAPATVAQTLQSLQSQGKLPTLDTSATVAGTDSDGNGVRDDLDKYLAALPDTAAQKNALTQLAQAIQASMLVDTTSAAALTATSLALNRADTCVWAVYSAGQSAKVQAIEELSVNTKTRLVAYEKYNAARHGAVVPSLSGSTCN